VGRTRKYIVQRLQQIADSLPDSARKKQILQRILRIKTNKQ